VPNTFTQQEGETDHLGILLPGRGYTHQMPLLYYSSFLLSASGADVLGIDYSYSNRPDYAAASSEEQMHWLIADVTSACRVALGNRNYSRVTLAAKSLGTMVAAYLLTQDFLPADTQTIWFTPVLGHEAFTQQVEQLRSRRRPSLIVIGTGDPYYDPDRLAHFAAATGGETLVIEGADHSMEMKGDLYASLDAMEQVMRGVETFLRGA
jgi:predicted alpha/beta-hydrolase family hydrolase